MRKTISAVIIACVAAVSFTAAAPAMADTVIIKVKPRPVVRKVVIVPRRVVVVPRRVIVAPRRVVVVAPHCYTKTVKRFYNNKTVVTKKRVCS